MDNAADREHRAGRYIAQPAGYRAFIPAPLPPDPPVALGAGLQALLSRADYALGRLDGALLTLPNPDLFVLMYVRKEAVLSSQIEGTQSSLQDLLAAEAAILDPERPTDVHEVLNYVRAMNHGLARLDELPVSSRLIREIHAVLMEGVRGGRLTPGEFRTSQNWIGPAGGTLGDAAFIPPPAHEVPGAVSGLERFLHREDGLPPLVKVGFAHAQFETIHPFLDGNGRLGRLLITLLLCGQERVLAKPLLYLSLYLKRHRDAYYERLQRVRTHGEWEEWVAFFLEGVVEVSDSAAETTRRLLALVDADRRSIQGLGRAAASAARLHDLVTREVVFRIPQAAARLESNEVTVGNAARNLEQLGIVVETTGRTRNKRYVYREYLRIIEEGTES